MQRLRHLNQLGLAEYAFPTAVHKRFAHSLGTAHLAYRAVKTLHDCDPSLDLRPTDAVEAEIGGLVHDFGHGPFSHTWDSEILPRIAPCNMSRDEIDQLWGHEKLSCDILEQIVDKGCVDLDDDALRRVHDMITVSVKGHSQRGKWPDDKKYLLQIVSNKEIGVDVDKMDYLLRDSLQCTEYRFDYRSLLDGMRVQEGHLAFPQTSLPKLQKLFGDRATMHQEVYTTREVRQAELMVVDAIVSAAPHIKGFLSGLDIMDWDVPGAYTSSPLYTDEVLGHIQRMKPQDEEPGVAKAQRILKRFNGGNMYPWCAEVAVPHDKLQHYNPCKQSLEERVACCQDHNSGVSFRAADIDVQQLKIDYSKGHRNPLEHVRLYRDARDTSAWTPPRGAFAFLPAHFLHRWLRVYLRADVDPSQRGTWIAAVAAAFTTCMVKDLGVDPAHVMTNQEAARQRHAGRNSGAPAASVGTSRAAASSQNPDAHGNGAGHTASLASGDDHSRRGGHTGHPAGDAGDAADGSGSDDSWVSRSTDGPIPTPSSAPPTPEHTGSGRQVNGLHSPLTAEAGRRDRDDSNEEEGGAANRVGRALFPDVRDDS